MMATLAVGAVIVLVAFVARRIVLGTQDPLPRRPSELWALAFGRSAPPPDPDLTDMPVTPPEPERPDTTRERGSAAT